MPPLLVWRSRVSRWTRPRRWMMAAGLLILAPLTLGAVSVQAQPAQPAQQVSIRAGDHADYTRLVFDWPEKVAYRVSRDGGLITLNFDAAAEINVAAINRAPPLFVGGVRAASADTASVAVVAVPENARVRDLLVGNRVVLDVFEPSEWQDPVALPASIEPPGAPVSTPPPQRANADTGTPTETTTSEDASVVEGPPLAAPQPPAVETAALTPPAPVVAALEETAEAPRPSGPLALTPPQREGAPAAESPSQSVPSPGAGSSGSIAETVPQTLVAPDDGSELADPLTGSRVTGEPIEDAKTTVSGGENNSVVLRFDWQDPVAAAVFRRSGLLWVVFDQRTNVDLEALRQAGAPAIEQIDQLRIPQATVLVITTAKDVNPKVRRDGLAWLLDFATGPIETAKPVEVQAQPNSPIGARIFVPLPEPGKVVPLTDPLVGDNIVVVPVIPLGHGVARQYSYPQFKLPITAQGILIEPLIDDLRVRSLRQGIEMASSAPTAPLQISAVSEAVAASSRLVSSRPLLRILDLGRWRAPDYAALMEGRRLLESTLSEAPVERRQEARLDLARFYTANGLGAEALGVLSSIESADEQGSLNTDREFRLLEGIAKFIMARYDEAERDFQFPGLDGNDEAEFWRAMITMARIEATQVDKADAAIELRRSSAIARPYPSGLRSRLGILIGEAAVLTGDIDNATTILDALEADQPSASEQDQINFVRAKLAELAGDFDGAVSLLEEVVDGTDRLYRFRAAWARVDLLTQLRRMEPDEAIAEFEKLRFAWRGDLREFNLLRRLGGLYLEQERYREGLQTLRQAATHYRELDDAKDITKLMSDTFNALYLEEKADVMPPVTAIAVYEEFKELTPAGKGGDEMIQKLADRLVGVELLDRAAALLDNQVNFRLSGQDKARVGARLGVVHLLARDFKASESAIRGSEVSDIIPEELTLQRTLVLAQALVGQNRDAEALALMTDAEGRDAEVLRAQIYWENADWANAGRSLQAIARNDGITRRLDRLTDEQARLIMSIATAMSLAGNERGLERVRSSFGPLMAATEFRDGFNLVVARPEEGAMPLDIIGERVQVAARFKDFLQAYEERLQNDPLSGLN